MEGIFLRQIRLFWNGLADALSWRKAIDSIYMSTEIRTMLKQIILLHLIFAFGIFLFDYVVIPITIFLTDLSLPTKVIRFFGWYLPMQIISLGMNVKYWGDISKTVEKSMMVTVQEETLQFEEQYKKRLFLGASGVLRILLVPGLELQKFTISFIPYIGKPLHFICTCLLYSFYAFEYHWNHFQSLIDRQIYLFERNWTYFLGFGLPTTLATYFLSSPYSECLFALLLSFNVLIASHSNLNELVKESETMVNQKYLRLPYFNIIVKKLGLQLFDVIKHFVKL